MKLSIIDKDILLTLSQFGYTNQRTLMDQSGYSIGSVNKSINILIQENMLDDSMALTKKAKDFIKASSPKNAIILAAGYGMRMVPINTETPKGMLTVDGVPLVALTDVAFPFPSYVYVLLDIVTVFAVLFTVKLPGEHVAPL